MTWPYRTDQKLKISGQFKSKPEDFFVEEIPLYLPVGTGEHLYLFIEKTGITTEQLINYLMRSLGISIKQIGYAGKKDKVGITRQWISVANVQKAAVEKLKIPSASIIRMDFHKNKLRLGHLKGNRFQIVIRNVSENGSEIARNILNDMARSGVPNYFGPQRFGLHGDNAFIGSTILQENWKKAFSLILGLSPLNENDSPNESVTSMFSSEALTQIIKSHSSHHTYAQSTARHLLRTKGSLADSAKNLPIHLTRFYLNALQSYWFNDSLGYRLASMDKLQKGDLAYLHRNGAVFKDELAEQSRADKFEISPSGPLWGYKMALPLGEELQLEENVLHQCGISAEYLIKTSRRLKLMGQRRSYRVPLLNYSVEQIESDLTLQFDLPGGSYATSVMRELMKDHLPEREIVKPNFESKLMEKV